jgi:hypothetical protein
MRPTLIRIMGMAYKIIYEKATLNRQTLGFINFWGNEITISGECCEEQQKQTLVHEVTHAFDMKMGISDQVSEEQNSSRSNMIFAWLRDPDNRAAIEWIMADGPERKGVKNANR